ncbi:MAG: LamG domain-containing protein [Ignavibacteriaceae bacterium]|nr:LamG domain-containing protein [Ignavibacteriaceae bacterium]
MKSLSLIGSFIVVFFLIECTSNEPTSPNITDQNSGKLFLQIDKENAPESVVWLEAFLTRQGFDSVSGEMNLLSDSTADILLENIQAGEWHLKVDASDSASVVLYTGETDIQIFAGFTTQVNLVLEPTGAGTGNVYIWVTWGTGTPSAFGKAIDFDGSGDYANTFNNPYFPTENGTLEALLKVRSIIPPEGVNDIGDAFISKNEEQWNTGDFYVFFEYYDAKLKSRVQAPPSSEVDVVSNNNFWQNTDTWFHYAFTWGSTGMRMYINGELQSSQNNINFSALNNNYNFYVGGHGYMLHSGNYVVTDFFDGQIDELRIWNYQKTGGEISALMNSPLGNSYFTTPDSGLVGYWRFDQLEDLGINNDGPDDVRDLSYLHNHLDLKDDAHLVPFVP